MALKPIIGGPGFSISSAGGGGGGLTSIPAGKSVFVDPTNGSDSTGAVHRQDKPFLTLGAAKTAASSGDTIFVLPGAYSATNLLKNGVNWHFHAGAVVTNSNSTSAIFDDWTSGSNAAVTSVITGSGVFDGSTSADGVVYIRQATSNIYLTCKSMTAANTTIKTEGQSTVYVDAQDISSTGASANAAVWWYDGPVHIKAKTIIGNGPAVVYTTAASTGTSAGYLWVQADQITNNSVTISTAHKAVWLQDNEIMQRVWINALQIQGPIAVQTTANGSIGYITAQKIFGQINIASSIGLLYLTAQKVSDDGLASNLVNISGGDTCWLNLGQLDDTGLGGVVAVTMSAGNCNFSCQSITRSTAGDAVDVSGGTFNFLSGVVTTQSGSLDFNQSSTGIINSASSAIIESPWITLADANIKALPTTPFTVLAAPGTGKSYKIIAARFILNATAGGYAGAGAVVWQLIDSLNLSFLTIQCKGDLSGASVQYGEFLAPALQVNVTGFAATPFTAPGQISDLANTGVQIVDNNGSGAYTGGNAANTLKIKIWYRILPSAP